MTAILGGGGSGVSGMMQLSREGDRGRKSE